MLLVALVLTAAMGAQQVRSRPLPMPPRAATRPRCKQLLKHGADVNGAQGDGMSALHWAAERGDAELADMLIFAGANISRGDAHRPVHAAAPRRASRQRAASRRR